jgi:hypothetical protein
MMSTAAIDNPENPSSRLVGSLGHNPVNELIEGGDACVRDHLSKDLAPKDIPGGVIGHGSPPLILKLDPLLVTGYGRQAGMTAGQDLDAFLIRREQILIGAQPLALPTLSQSCQVVHFSLGVSGAVLYRC